MKRPSASRGTPCRATSGSSVRSQPAASTHADEPGEELGAVGEQLDEPGARTGSRQEALDLVERRVGVGSLPERVEEHRVEALERRVELARVGHERAPLEDAPEVVARAVGIGEPRGTERHDAREPNGATPPLARATHGVSRAHGPRYNRATPPLARATHGVSRARGPRYKGRAEGAAHAFSDPPLARPDRARRRRGRPEHADAPARPPQLA